MLLYPSIVLLLPHHQVLCYCSLAKPDPRTKCKSLVSQDFSYWVVFVDKNVMAEISTQSRSLHFALHVCISILGYYLSSVFLNSSNCAPHAWYCS